MPLLFVFPTEQTRGGQSRTNTDGCVHVCDLKAIDTALTLSSHRNGHGTCRCPLVADTRAPAVDSWGHVGRELLFVPLFHCETFDWIKMRVHAPWWATILACLHKNFPQQKPS